MAIDKPVGKAIKIAMEVVKRVPEISGNIPKCFSEKSGVHCVSVKKSFMETFEKKLDDSDSRTQSIPIVVSTLIAAHNINIVSIIFSFLFIMSYRKA
jgi:hypothetical protein